MLPLFQTRKEKETLYNQLDTIHLSKWKESFHENNLVKYKMIGKDDEFVSCCIPNNKEKISKQKTYNNR